MLIALATAAVSALVTAHFALVTTESDMEKMLFQGERDDAESTAALFSTKVDKLRDALKAVVRQAPPELWRAMSRHLTGNSAIGLLFEGVLAAAPDDRPHPVFFVASDLGLILVYRIHLRAMSPPTTIG